VEIHYFIAYSGNKEEDRLKGFEVAVDFWRLHGKNDFAERSKILLDLKTILLEP